MNEFSKVGSQNTYRYSNISTSSKICRKKLENENQDNLYNIPHPILKRSVFCDCV